MSGIPSTEHSLLPTMNEQMSFLSPLCFLCFSKRSLSALTPPRGPPRAPLLSSASEQRHRSVFRNTNPAVALLQKSQQQSPCSHKRSTVAHKRPPIRAPLASSVSLLATFSLPGDTPPRSHRRTAHGSRPAWLIARSVDLPPPSACSQIPLWPYGILFSSANVPVLFLSLKPSMHCSLCLEYSFSPFVTCLTPTLPFDSVPRQVCPLESLSHLPTSGAQHRGCGPSGAPTAQHPLLFQPYPFLLPASLSVPPGLFAHESKGSVYPVPGPGLILVLWFNSVQ